MFESLEVLIYSQQSSFWGKKKFKIHEQSYTVREHPTSEHHPLNEFVNMLLQVSFSITK